MSSSRTIVWSAGRIVCLTLICGLPCLETVAAAPAEGLRIDRVFFAQQHVLEPDSPFFELVGELDALVKVQLYSTSGAAAPVVAAVLENGPARRELLLRGPAVLPPPYTGPPEMMPHRFEDSFTGTIPADWVRPGLRVTIELRRYDYTSDPLTPAVTVLADRDVGAVRVGAPNRVKMTMFDFHFFGGHLGRDYPDGWLDELQAKLPVSGIDLQRVRGIRLSPFSMMPRLGKPAIKAATVKEYEERAGVAFDGEQRIALMMLSALQRASGYHGFFVHHFATIGGVHSGGAARGYFGVANLNRPGVLIHELGHSFGLPHWGVRETCPYPHKGPMFGVPTKSDDMPHVGPFWAYDLHRRAFISPIVESNPAIPSRGVTGQWKLDPMRGGGTGDQANYYAFRHFGAYSVQRMRQFIAARNARWDDVSAGYFVWSPETNAYSEPVGHRAALAVRHEVPVISLLFTLSGVTAEANHIYAPIGPYTAGLPQPLDASDADDRKAADDAGFADRRCNVCIRVTQGGAVKSYLVRAAIDRQADPVKPDSFRVAAINLPAAEGEVTRAELLYAPDVIANGIPRDPEVLCGWQVP